MKNIKRIAAFLIAAVIACVCLVSCSGKDDFVGKWELEEMDMNGTTMTGTMMGIVPLAWVMQVELKSDGTGYRQSVDTGSGEDKRDDLTWEYKDGKAVITSDGESVEFELSGGMLSAEMEQNGQKAGMKLKKVDSFTEYDPSKLTGLLGGGSKD